MIEGLEQAKQRFYLYAGGEKPSDSCKEWNGGLFANGYGSFWFSNKNIGAHRVSYALANNLELVDIEGLVIRHTCDNPTCVNPKHLISGTTKDNAQDKVIRGRSRLNSPHGEEHYRAKLTADQVEELKSKYYSGSKTQRQLMSEYGISATTVHNIVRGKSWRGE